MLEVSTFEARKRWHLGLFLRCHPLLRRGWHLKNWMPFSAIVGVLAKTVKTLTKIRASGLVLSSAVCSGEGFFKWRGLAQAMRENAGGNPFLRGAFGKDCVKGQNQITEGFCQSNMFWQRTPFSALQKFRKRPTECHSDAGGIWISKWWPFTSEQIPPASEWHLWIRQIWNLFFSRNRAGKALSKISIFY